MTGSFPLTIETPDAIATQVLNVLFYGLPVEQLQSFRDRVNAVRPDDIERVARYYLRPDRLSIVLVGNAAAFASQLRGLGFTTFEVVEMDGSRSHGGRLPAAGRAAARPRCARRSGAGWRAGVPRASAISADGRVSAVHARSRRAVRHHGEEGAAARALLDAIVAAKGGLERLRAVKSIVATTARGALGAERAARHADDGHLHRVPQSRARRVEASAGATSCRCSTARAPGCAIPNGTHDVPRARSCATSKTASGATRSALLLAADRRPASASAACPTSRTSAGAVRQALEFSGADLDPMVMYVDPATGLVVKQTYVAGGHGAAARRGDLQRLPRGRRRADQLRGERARRRRTPRSSGPSRPSSSMVRSIRRCSNARPLEPASAALLRRAVRRSLCRAR